MKLKIQIKQRKKGNNDIQKRIKKNKRLKKDEDQKGTMQEKKTTINNKCKTNKKKIKTNKKKNKKNINTKIIKKKK